MQDNGYRRDRIQQNGLHRRYARHTGREIRGLPAVVVQERRGIPLLCRKKGQGRQDEKECYKEKQIQILTVMEEKKQNAAPAQEGAKKLDYDGLRKTCSELAADNRQLSYRVEQMGKALEQANKMLESRDFDYTSFMLSMMFKVVEHPEMYSDEFVKWTVANIESSLKTFVEEMQAAGEQLKEQENVKQNEAE